MPPQDAFDPAALLVERLQAVDVATGPLADADIVVASGSLVAGFGNPTSDTDLYAVGTQEPASDMSLVVDRQGFYEDVEFHTHDGVRDAWVNLERAAAEPWSVVDIRGPLELIRRIDIGQCLKGQTAFDKLRSDFDPAVMRVATVAWACRGMWDRLARGDLEAVGPSDLGLRVDLENWLWELTFGLLGDRYPTPKWRIQRLESCRGAERFEEYTERVRTAVSLLDEDPSSSRAVAADFVGWLAERTDADTAGVLASAARSFDQTPALRPVSEIDWLRCGQGGWHAVLPRADVVWTTRRGRRPMSTDHAAAATDALTALEIVDAGGAVLFPVDRGSVASMDVGRVRHHAQFADDMAASLAEATVLVAFERDATGALEVGQDYLLRSACVSMVRSACRVLALADGVRPGGPPASAHVDQVSLAAAASSIRDAPAEDVLPSTVHFVEGELGVAWPDFFNGRMSAFALEQSRVKRLLKRIGREGAIEAVLDARSFASGASAGGEIDVSVRGQ